MTHRKGEDFTLTALTNIPGPNASGTNSNYPFYTFLQSYIEPGTITKLSTGDSNIPLGLYKEVDGVGFLDSLHDFKSDFFDCQAPIKGDGTKFSFKKFGFTFLLKGGYPDLLTRYPNLLMQTQYSYLNRIPRPLNQDNLENYFSLGNIYDVINNTTKGQMYILPNTRTPSSGTTKEAHFTNIYNKLKGFYSSYADPEFNGAIKLVVDAQLNLFDIISKNRPKPTHVSGSDFCILYTAETITDPAPKTKAGKLDSIFGCENWYIENLPGTRSYNFIFDNIGGGVNVTFQNLSLTTPTDLENSKFVVNVTYSNGGKSVSENIKMNSTANTIQNIKNTIRNTIEIVVRTAGTAGAAAGALVDTFTLDAYKVSTTLPGRKPFYETFNSDITTDSNKVDYTRDYTIYYARKRLGDTLQGRVCLNDKLNTLQFNTVTKNDKKYKVNQGNKTATTAAVLVTHDRMLFSYAVIKGVPTILDLKDNMILFVPTTKEPITKEPITEKLITKEPTTTEKQPYKKQKVGGGQKIISNASVQKGGNILDTDYAIESILNSVDDLIRFFYFINDRRTFFVQQDFKYFLEKVNIALQAKTLSYAYLGNYYNNTLVIAPIGEIESVIENITSTVDSDANRLRNSQRLVETNPEYYALINNPIILYIKLDDENFIEVKREMSTINGLQIRIEPGKLKLNNNTYNGEYIFNKPSITTLLSGITEAVANNIYEDLVIAVPIAPTNNSTRVLATILVGGIDDGIYLRTTGSIGGGEPNDTPLYESILNADFNKLNNPKNLLQNNGTVIYFLFDLLRSYELSFIGYQEGIDAFYIKIDESGVLSDMIGVTNLIPHNIEFYVFLKLILQDYSEANLNNINYALFEYYLYILKNNNNIYSHFQDIKSYFLDTNYEITVTPDIISTIQSSNIKSLQYFNSVTAKAMQISQTIISQNYNATQSDNFDIIRKNAHDYSLKLCGFTEMKTEFINKTLDIVSSMMSKGLLLQYVSQSKSLVSTSAAGIQPGNRLISIKPINPINPINPIPLAVGVGGNIISASSLRKKRRSKNNSNKRRHIHKKQQQTMKKVSKRKKTHRK